MGFRDVKVGDHVTRSMAGIEQDLLVTDLTDDLIICNPFGWDEGWSFDRETGMEVDEELRWGPKYGITGTYLVRK